MLSVCETVCNRDVSMCLWKFNTHYASNSIFSGANLRDFMFIGTDHQPVIRTQSFYFQSFKKDKAIQFQHKHSNLLPHRQ